MRLMNKIPYLDISVLHIKHGTQCKAYIDIKHLLYNKSFKAGICLMESRSIAHAILNISQVLIG